MTTSEEIQKSIVLITDGETKPKNFGTGFIIRHVSGFSYILTCAHVVKAIKSSGNIKVGEQDAIVVVSGEEEGLDLAVLKANGLSDKPSLEMDAVGSAETEFLTAGFQAFSNTHLIRPLEGVLGESVGLQSSSLGERIQAWDLVIRDDYNLQRGYSGSPVVDKATGKALGIISFRQGEGKKGLAISIEAIQNIWKYTDANQLYRSLLKLGYSKQVRLFRQLIKNHSIAALLIYGPPDHGQRWLLNLLMNKHLPYLMTSRVIKVALNRRGRRFDSKGLWRELCRYLELEPTSTTEEIVQRVYESWKTQNIILVLHQVNRMPRQSLQQLIEDFWSPLAREIEAALDYSKSSNKLLMFLIDYEGTVGSLETFFKGQKSLKDQCYEPIKAPKISQFSEDDLLIWLEKESDELPSDLAEEFDETVDEILKASEQGVPELTLEEICSRCGFNWYEESEKWLKY